MGIGVGEWMGYVPSEGKERKLESMDACEGMIALLSANGCSLMERGVGWGDIHETQRLQRCLQ